MERMFQQILDDERRERELMMEWGRSYQEGTPAYRRLRDAADQACVEIVGRYPDPCHPLITSPAIKKQIDARIEEILHGVASE